MKTLFTRIISVCLLLALATGTDAGQKEILVFGVHPFKKPRQIHKMFKPLTEHIAKQTGKQVKIVIGKSYADIIKQHERGKVDFGYFGPASYVAARKEVNIIPLARIKTNGRGAFRGVIIVRADSPVKNISQLKGKSFAFGDPESTLSHYVPHYMLLRAGITLSDLKKYAFTGNHDNVALNVLHGGFDAGGMKPAVAEQYIKKGLRILTKSQWIPEHLFAASGKLDSKERSILQKVLLKTDASILKSIKPLITGMEPAADKDYDGLRKIIKEVSQNDPAPNSSR